VPQFTTISFPNTPAGQQAKIKTLNEMTSQGWHVVSETITPGKFRGGTACCLFTLCAPLAFLAGHSDDMITVTLQSLDMRP
jgi:hypothetical protein